ncbi:gamma interferon inducible lysosomal thiol reductase (GILT) domain-containing protein [Sarocladium implicatum]|nr:gamma interferon inducible lysosomal thiol reductase (GILT) domain-containing protein [Sarocladium implicatum]
MDEKLTHPLPDRSSSTPPQTCQHSVSATMAPRRTRAVVAVLLVFVALYSLYQTATFTSLAISTLAPGIALSGGQRENGFSTKDLVPLEAHIISKCPDTRDALRQLILPAMQQVHDKVDFTLSYIGRPTANDGVDCKHGPSECLGNIIELCACELYPDPKISLGFVMCLTKDYRHIPERTLVEDCALEHALDFDALNECATRDDGAHGMEMLRNSVLRSAEVSKRDHKLHCPS